MELGDGEIRVPAHPAPRVIESGPLAGAVIEFAGQLELSDYPAEEARFCDALCELFGIGGVWLSDETAISDFEIDSEAECERLQRHLGVEVRRGEFVIEILRRMRQCGP